MPLLVMAPPRSTAGAASLSWSQDAHDAQHTGYTSQEPSEPWTFLWSWNGPDLTGGTGNHFYNAPLEARTVAGGGFIYVPAGSSGLYALNELTGVALWHDTSTSYNAAPAYDPVTGNVLAGGADGYLHEFNALTGVAVATFNAGNPIDHAIILAGSSAYALTDDGHLYKVAIAGLAPAWVYAAGASAGTMPAYSPSRNELIFGTSDLYVHAVNDADGSLHWRVKPSPNAAGAPVDWTDGWPVIAEQHGIVFMRMNLTAINGSGGLSDFGNTFTTNAQVRSYLQSNPSEQNLFALSLDTGASAFVPAVGYGGTEDTVNGSPESVLGQVPVVAVWPNGDEVAYETFRMLPSQGDYRWNGHIGEMVLDSTTVSGMSPGDLRFVGGATLDNGTYTWIIDEENPLSMAGTTMFHAHWGTQESWYITNRATSLGGSYTNPITTSLHPPLMRRIQANGNFNALTHWTTGGLTLYADTRTWPNPGWWTYWNVVDPSVNVPPDAPGSRGYDPRYTYVSDGLIISEGNGGELMVFSTANQPAPTPTPEPYSFTLSPILK